MKDKYNLRERKKAILKLNMIEALNKELYHKRFEDIKVKDLCYTLNISEVTFFNYFSMKEELLNYMMLVWNYKRELRIHREGRLNGLKGIYKIFEDISSTDNARPIMLAFISYYMKLEERPLPLVLNDCEKWLIDEQDAIEVMSLNDQFKTYILQAQSEGDLCKALDVDAYDELLSSIYFGGPVISHMTGKPLKEVFKSNLDQLFERGDGHD